MTSPNGANDMQTESALQQFREQERAWMKEQITRRGWALQSVLGDAQGLPFTYTVGLTLFDGHPELFMIGLDEQGAGPLLNCLAARVRAGHRLTDGTILDDVVEGYPFALLRLPDAVCAEHLLSANE